MPGTSYEPGACVGLPTPPHPTPPHTNTNKNQKVDLAPLLDHCEMARVNLPLCRPGQRRPAGKGLLMVRKMIVFWVWCGLGGVVIIPTAPASPLLIPKTTQR